MYVCAGEYLWRHRDGVSPSNGIPETSETDDSVAEIGMSVNHG